MLKLPNITLCTLGDKEYEAENQLALDNSSKDIEFGAVKNIIHKCGSIDAWNKAIIYDLWKYIDTDYAILIHADGGIIHPELWNPDWLNYDYIGAPWPLPTDDYSYRTPDGEIIRVGNSVSLRSKKIMELPTKKNLEWRSFYGNTNEDGYLCCHFRRFLQQCGMKFAPLSVAKYFSKEHEIPENKDIIPFAFHSL
jgi:hypothetical protein